MSAWSVLWWGMFVGLSCEMSDEERAVVQTIHNFDFSISMVGVFHLTRI